MMDAVNHGSAPESLKNFNGMALDIISDTMALVFPIHWTGTYNTLGNVHVRRSALLEGRRIFFRHPSEILFA